MNDELRFHATVGYRLRPDRHYLVEAERGDLYFVKTGGQFALAEQNVHTAHGAKGNNAVKLIFAGALGIAVGIGLPYIAYLNGHYFFHLKAFIAAAIGVVMLITGLLQLGTGGEPNSAAIRTLIAQGSTFSNGGDVLLFQEGRCKGKLIRPARQSLEPYLTCHPHNFAFPLSDVTQAELSTHRSDSPSYASYCKLKLHLSAEPSVVLTIIPEDGVTAFRSSLRRTFAGRFSEPAEAA